MNAAVGPPLKTVEQSLNVAAPEAGEHDALHVGLAVLVGVLEIDDVGAVPTNTPPS